jgi:hypothetical protein
VNNTVRSLATYDGQLYVGGAFTQAGGAAANRIARWNGVAWSTVGTGANANVEVMRAYNDGAQTRLAAAGAFTTISGTTASRIALFDGTNWSAIGAGANNTVLGLAAWNDGGGPSLVLGGNFTSAGGSAVNRVARYRGCPLSVVPILGCAGNSVTLAGVTAVPKIGTPFSCQLQAPAVPNGVAILMFGAPGIDQAGCGFFLPGLGEALLAPVPGPTVLFEQLYAGGTSTFTFGIPNNPGLVGLSIAFQGAAVNIVPPHAVQLSTGLRIKIRP